MKNLKYLDIVFVVVGVLIVIFAKSPDTVWRETVITALGGAIIGAAFAYAAVRRDIALDGKEDDGKKG